ncbi:MAG: FmdE family protein [Thermodesulfobacteriota bacterium]
MVETCIGPHTFDEFVTRAAEFHGYPAPGLLLGGFMVAAAQARLPEGILYDAVSETAWCLPDAIQMLTPCTVGNGWLRVLNLGIYAVALYDKSNGEGVRVSLDPAALNACPHMREWLLKLAPKREQDSDALRREIAERGAAVCRVEDVVLDPAAMARRGKGRIALCPLCGEAYPARHGGICRLCQGDGPYERRKDRAGVSRLWTAPPGVRAVPVEKAVGKPAMHDMTRIVPGESKGPAVLNGHVITAGDVCRLQQMGKNRIFVQESAAAVGDWIHEDEAAMAFSTALAGPGVAREALPREGKVNLAAEIDGLLRVDAEILERFNLAPGVMAATRHDGGLVKAGTRVAGTRAIPLYLPREDFLRALAALEAEPAVSVLPLRRARAGILVTGDEVFKGLVKDGFGPLVTSKLAALGSETLAVRVVPDDRSAIADATEELLVMGADLLVTTAGLSVDPDDVTRQGLLDAGAQDLLYGAPILPGAMTLLARIGKAQVLGVPACALFFKTTSLDLLLPRLLAGVPIRRRDLARMGHGAMCQECKTCTYPKCPFGR